LERFQNEKPGGRGPLPSGFSFGNHPKRRTPPGEEFLSIKVVRVRLG